MEKLMSYLKNPMVLIGLAVAIFFMFKKKKVIKKRTKRVYQSARSRYSNYKNNRMMKRKKY